MYCFAASTFMLLITLVSDENTYSDLAIIFTQANKRTRVLLSDIATINPVTLPFNPSLKTIVWFCGYNSDVFSGNYFQAQFETLGGYNFIIIDWAAYNQGSYVDAVNNVSPIAKKYAATLVGLASRGLIAVNSLHFMGFSLGAHLAGNTAREANLLSDSFNVPRITALDPASTNLFPSKVTANSNFQELKKTDATFVDVIHTDVMLFGMSMSLGTVDFFPNNGVNPQPGCPVYIPFSLDHTPLKQIPPNSEFKHRNYHNVNL